LTNNAKRLLTEASILPPELPENFTFRKVREILDSLKDAGEDKLREAVEALQRLQIRGPLAATIFIKHHLAGAHEAEIDRVDESEDGAQLAVLVYPEGEVPVQTEHLPPDISAGRRVRYDPSAGQYQSTASSG
jgi:hypothetical protein